MNKIKITFEAGVMKNEDNKVAGKVDISIISSFDKEVSLFVRSNAKENNGIYEVLLWLTDMAKNHVRDEMLKECLKRPAREDSDKPSMK